MKSVTPKPPAKTLIASILEGAYECEHDHPFLTANGIEGAPCLTYSGDLKISGVEIHGCAFAKICDSECVIVNMLFKVKVDEATYEDMLLPGHPLEGTFIHTFLIGEARIAPILGIFSPVPECGKTTVLGLLLRLVFMPVSTSNLTPAVLYRVVNQLSPTLLIDEADTFLQSRELNGVINCGHTRDTAYVQRMESGTVKRYRTFSPKAIGMIGLPSDTVLSRAIAIHLRRKLNTDIKLQLPLGDDVEIAAVRARVARWARDNQEAVAGAQLVLPKFGSGRAADNWEPLLAIAHTLGPICYESAKQAATVLTRKHAKVSCTSEDLLRDIKAAFEKAKTERFPTALLINQLCADDEAPWGTFSKGRPITPTELARLLRAFDISSENMRLNGGVVVKGYKLAQFEDAFSRYVPANRQ